ncbi:hypothetical protein Tco_0578383 [Tanacetum coccineum]
MRFHSRPMCSFSMVQLDSHVTRASPVRRVNWASQQVPAPGNWNMDTGASSYLNDSVSNLCDTFNMCIYPYVSVGDGHSIPISNSGHSILTTSHRPLHLHNVLITPNIDFLTHQLLLRCDSTEDLYPITKSSTIPHTFLTRNGYSRKEQKESQKRPNQARNGKDKVKSKPKLSPINHPTTNLNIVPTAVNSPIVTSQIHEHTATNTYDSGQPTTNEPGLTNTYDSGPNTPHISSLIVVSPSVPVIQPITEPATTSLTQTLNTSGPSNIVDTNSPATVHVTLPLAFVSVSCVVVARIRRIFLDGYSIYAVRKFSSNIFD